MKYCGKTDIGIKRLNNQDSYAVFSKNNYFCAIVCDGMGGAKGGNIASGLAVKTFASTVKSAFSERNADDFNEAEIKALLRTALNNANTAVYNKSLTDSELEGMGTTLVVALVCLCGTFALNVGDSRIYRQYDGTTQQISKDHSFVQYLLDKGEITQQEAENHPYKNIILRALGVNEHIEGDYYRIDRYERILLCSDGLTNHVTDERIGEIISGAYSTKKPSYKTRVERLIDEANVGGGLDNITAVLFGGE